MMSNRIASPSFCMYVCMYVCVYVCMHGCMYVCMYVYIYICVCVFMCIRMCICVYVYIYIWYDMIWYDMCVCARVWENTRVKMNIWYHTPMSFQRPCLGSWLLWCRLHELLGSLPARQCLDLQNALGIADGQLLGFWDDLRTHKSGISSAGTNASVLHIWIEILYIYVDIHIYTYICICIYIYIYIIIYLFI